MCEFCGNDKDIIFPFQLSKCQRCEGEPSTRAPSARISFPLNWKDWKISNPRRLAKILQRDREEGEGGEEDIQLGSDQGDEAWEEELRGSDDLRLDKGGLCQTAGKANYAVPWIIVNEDEREMSGSSESQREEKVQPEEGGEDLHVHSQAKNNRRGNGEEHSKREHFNLLTVLKIGRFKKNIKQDRSSDDDTCSSRESLDKGGQEGNGRRRVLALASRVRRFSKPGKEDESGTAAKEESANEELTNRPPEKGERAEEEQKAQSETLEPETFTAMKLPTPHRLTAVFSKEGSRGEEDGHSSDDDGKSGMNTEEGQVGPVGAARPNWRSHQTRKARRVSRGRKIRERRGGDNDGRNECTEGAGDQEENS